jgi:ribose transport system substrate-binding protein
VLDGLAEAGPDVQVIDRYVSPADQTRDRVFQIMTTAVQQSPGINVVLGVDGFVLPAYRAFEQTGMLSDDLYFAGVDGDPEALGLVAQGGPYRASHAFAWTLMGYGMGRFAADWVAGRTVPRLIVARATLVDSPETARDFLAAADDPRATFADHRRYDKYLPLLGNVSFADRATTWTASYEL